MTLEEFSKLVESKKGTTVYRGVTPLSLLGVAFVIMKLLGCITWSWWWVLAPFWIPLCMVLVIFFVAILFLSILAICEKKASKKEVVTEKEKESLKKKATTKKVKKDGGSSKEKAEASSK